eukprot:5774371-Pyramimonas_sp.AAC.1
MLWGHALGSGFICRQVARDFVGLDGHVANLGPEKLPRELVGAVPSVRTSSGAIYYRLRVDHQRKSSF